MKTHYIFNEKDNENYTKEFSNLTELRHWIINHLDQSKRWRACDLNNVKNEAKSLKITLKDYEALAIAKEFEKQLKTNPNFNKSNYKQAIRIYAQSNVLAEELPS